MSRAPLGNLTAEKTKYDATYAVSGSEVVLTDNDEDIMKYVDAHFPPIDTLHSVFF